MKLRFSEKLIVGGLKSIGQLSLPSIYRLVLLVNWVLKPFPLRVKKTIARNVERCFPELSRQEQKQFVKQALFHTFWRILEMSFFWFADLTRVNTVKLEVIGETQFQQDYQLKQGMILIEAHFGAWEMLNAYLSQRYDSVTLYKPLKYAYQEKLVHTARNRYGGKFFPASVAGVKQIFMALKQGKCLSLMVDHDPGENGGIIAPFFGLPANTAILPIKLIQKTDAPVYIISVMRLPKGKGFSLEFKKMDDKEIRHASLEAAAACINQIIETIVKRAPEQYEWSYKRFRRTPTATGKGFYE